MKNELADALSQNTPNTAEVADIPNIIQYGGRMACMDHIERKPIRISRDLMDLRELGMVDSEHKDLIKDIKSAVSVDCLPCNHILRQFVRKTKSIGAQKNAYDEMYTVDTRNGELVY